MKSSTVLAPLFLMLVLIVFVFSLTAASKKSPMMTYSELQKLIKSGQSNKISKVIVVDGESTIQVCMAGEDYNRQVIVPTELKDRLMKEFDDCGVAMDVKVADKSTFWSSLFSSFFLPILLLIGFLFMFRSAEPRPPRPPDLG